MCYLKRDWLDNWRCFMGTHKRTLNKNLQTLFSKLCNWMHFSLLPRLLRGAFVPRVAWSTFFGGAIGNIPTFFTLPMTVIIVSDLLSDITQMPLLYTIAYLNFETETLWPKRVNRNVTFQEARAHWVVSISDASNEEVSFLSASLAC